ncbi:MAG: four helix bundle protein [Pirellulales bacterium]
MQLAKSVYELTRNYPKEELYGLVSQLRRAAVSIPSNIAEGHTRGFTKEYLHHLAIAQGSLSEVETQLFLSIDLGMGESAGIEDTLRNCFELGRMLNSLRSSLKNRMAPDNNRRENDSAS